MQYLKTKSIILLRGLKGKEEGVHLMKWSCAGRPNNAKLKILQPSSVLRICFYIGIHHHRRKKSKVRVK